MKNKKTNLEESERLDTISFRGERKVWLKFLSVMKKQGRKNAWEVLKHLIQNYLLQEEKK